MATQSNYTTLAHSLNEPSATTYGSVEDPAFDSRSYGHKQLSLLIKSRPELFDMRESKTSGGPSLIYVKPAHQ